MINNLLVDTVAQLAAKDVVEVAKPPLDNFIMETYGKLPQRLEVVTEKKTNVVQGITHEKFETVLQLANCNIPVFLTDPAGCGKNVLCKQVSEALDIEFYFSNAVTQEYKPSGRYEPERGMGLRFEDMELPEPFEIPEDDIPDFSPADLRLPPEALYKKMMGKRGY